MGIARLKDNPVVDLESVDQKLMFAKKFSAFFHANNGLRYNANIGDMCAAACCGSKVRCPCLFPLPSSRLAAFVRSHRSHLPWPCVPLRVAVVRRVVPVFSSSFLPPFTRPSGPPKFSCQTVVFICEYSSSCWPHFSDILTHFHSFIHSFIYLFIY